MILLKKSLVYAAGFVALFTSILSAELDPALKTAVDQELNNLKALSTDSVIVAAVKAYNLKAPAEYAGMTNDKWKTLPVTDPLVRGLAKNAIALHVKENKEPCITELFISAADGCKVAFLAKTTSWTHKGKPKHDVPMTGKTWIGEPEVDESTGQRQIQVGIPVLDGKKAIGSIVIGLSVSSLQEEHAK